MKTRILFKTLIDILFFLQIIALLSAVFIVPLGMVNINMYDLPINQWNAFHWLLFLGSVICFFSFTLGLYFLRKLGRAMLSRRPFTLTVVKILKKCGAYFMVSGALLLLLHFLAWFAQQVYQKTTKIELIYDTNMVIPFFLLIIGLFFRIQSNNILEARMYKEDSTLTI
ncbi:MAG: DUF2975 domain-containing protein [Flavobacteriaceae bacterium]|nr:DUF2975 domain-containing protein [Flavobacteriaceae bacterium]